MYESGKILFLVYEDISVSYISLVNIQDSPRDLLNEIEIAIVCKQVSILFLKKKGMNLLIYHTQMLYGLFSIYKKLEIIYDNINSINTLITERGEIKIDLYKTLQFNFVIC